MIYPSYNWAIENGRLSQYVRIRQDAFTKTFNRSVLAHIPHSSPLLAPPLVIACERQHSTFFTTLPGMSSRTPSFIFILNFCSCLRFQTQHIMACERQHSTFFATLKGKSNSQWDEHWALAHPVVSDCTFLSFHLQHNMAHMWKDIFVHSSQLSMGWALTPSCILLNFCFLLPFTTHHGTHAKRQLCAFFATIHEMSSNH